MAATSSRAGLSWREFRDRIRDDESRRRQEDAQRDAEIRRQLPANKRPQSSGPPKQPKGILRGNQPRPQPKPPEDNRPVDVNDPRYKINPKKKFYHEEEIPRQKQAGVPVRKANDSGYRPSQPSSSPQRQNSKPPPPQFRPQSSRRPSARSRPPAPYAGPPTNNNQPRPQSTSRPRRSATLPPLQRPTSTRGRLPPRPRSGFNPGAPPPPGHPRRYPSYQEPPRRSAGPRYPLYPPRRPRPPSGRRIPPPLEPLPPPRSGPYRGPPRYGPPAQRYGQPPPPHQSYPPPPPRQYRLPPVRPAPRLPPPIRYDEPPFRPPSVRRPPSMRPVYRDVVDDYPERDNRIHYVDDRPATVFDEPEEIHLPPPTTYVVDQPPRQTPVVTRVRRRPRSTRPVNDKDVKTIIRPAGTSLSPTPTPSVIVSDDTRPTPNPSERPEDHDSVTNSLSTIYLTERGQSAAGSNITAVTPPIKSTTQAFAVRQPSARVVELRDSDSVTLPSIDESQVYEDRYRSFASTGHEDWPIYKYSKDGGIACLLRVSPGALEDVRRTLKLVDGLPPDQQARMPKLPASEFDADEEVVMSPMQLIWDQPNKKFPASKMPLYVIMPVDTNVYNDALQQLMFLYTVDFKPWQIAEGRVIHIPIDGVEHEFYESIIHEPFNNIIFDVKARYIENTKMIAPEGGEIYSTMEPGLRALVHRRTFDENAKVKIRVEPLDMNETELHTMIPALNVQNIVALSPIIKITSSEITKRPITVYIPKPGMSIYGSTKLGLKSRQADLRGVKIRLFTKDRAISKYQLDAAAMQREFATEVECNLRVLKDGGSSYVFLAMTAIEPEITRPIVRNEYDYDDQVEFLNGALFRQLSAEIEPDELKIRSLGRQLLNFNATNDIFRSIDGDTAVAVIKILHRWKSSNRSQDESAMVRQLVQGLRECGFAKEAMLVQMHYREFLTDREGKHVMVVFDELKSCPAVMTSWRSLGRALGLPDDELRRIARDSGGDLRRRCLAVLRRSFDFMKEEELFYRDMLLRYIEALEKIGCPHIAAAVESRHLDKFYTNAL